MNAEKITLYGVEVIDNHLLLQSAHYIVDHNKGMLMMYYDGGDRNNKLPGYLFLDQIATHDRLADSPEQAITKFIKHQEALIEIAKNLLPSVR